jgi:NAD(P)-dependent dehydrogenase (short-subunit alcohol dehydrogenase family)
MPTALVTGAGSGIGHATARRLAAEGWHVVAAGRSRARLGRLLEAISSDGGSAESLEIDLASFRSIRHAASVFRESGRRLDALVNNAGIGVNRRLPTEDGFEPHFGINHLGHFLLTRELAPALVPGGRVVSLASAVHHRAKGIDLDRARSRTSLTGYPEYARSKLANILFIRELARRQPALGAYAVHPGLVDTPLIPLVARIFAGRTMLTPEQGADTVVWCASSEQVADQSGLYYHDRAVALPSPQARDDDLARELWERSEAWTS